jgi:Zn-dependent alcohol dehydrogenase
VKAAVQKAMRAHAYALDDINQAYADQRAGKVVKTLIKP